MGVKEQDKAKIGLLDEVLEKQRRKTPPAQGPWLVVDLERESFVNGLEPETIKDVVHGGRQVVAECGYDGGSILVYSNQLLEDGKKIGRNEAIGNANSIVFAHNTAPLLRAEIRHLKALLVEKLGEKEASREIEKIEGPIWSSIS